MRTVECRLDENEFKTITEEAKRLGVFRSELIRSKLTSAPQYPCATTPTPSATKPTPAKYLDTVSLVRRRMRNSLSASQVEQCVALTIQCLYG